MPELEPALGTIPVIVGAKCLRERGTKRRFESDIIWGSAGLRPDPIFVTSSVEAVRSMVADGMGITILSDMVYRPWSLEGQRIELRKGQRALACDQRDVGWSLHGVGADHFRHRREWLIEKLHCRCHAIILICL